MDLQDAETLLDFNINTDSSQMYDGFQELMRMNTSDLFIVPAESNLGLLENNSSLHPDSFFDTDFIKNETKPIPNIASGCYGEGQTVPKHFKEIPGLDDIEMGPYNFNIQINGQPNSASLWCLSSNLKNIYVKKNTSITFDVSYIPDGASNLKLRIMLVCSSSQEVHKPISRCQDHISKDKANNSANKDHIVRCLNPTATYTGQSHCANYGDRLAVMVDLNSAANNQMLGQQTLPVTLDFLCQNSCSTIERRPTSLLFMLENEYGALLGRKSFRVKICSCPKRDMEKDEKKTTGGSATKKRKHVDDVDSTCDQSPAKKLNRASTKNATPSNCSEACSSGSVTSSSGGGVKEEEATFTPLGRSLSTLSSSSLENDSSMVMFKIRMPDAPTAISLANYAYMEIATKIVSCTDEDQLNRYKKYLRDCRRTKPMG
ncbi:cellular tumor antigen p53-like [Anopheles nili]|uniref:cellular tumor antigen p53-like n=1 Tax=Anopheles nili TaxID=185578 RepID=UPI00237A746E|nr:cellular tumor antigen p53-like [Anopheles nili]